MMTISKGNNLYVYFLNVSIKEILKKKTNNCDDKRDILFKKFLKGESKKELLELFLKWNKEKKLQELFISTNKRKIVDLKDFLKGILNV
jgi:hypothetical protein